MAGKSSGVFILERPTYDCYMRLLFFLLLTLLASISCVQEVEKEKTFSSNNFTVHKLAAGVYGCVNKIGGKAISNSGVIDNGDATIIFDCFLSPTVAEELLALVDSFDLSPIKYVINSHAHNDHIRGNQVFGEEVCIISTQKTRDTLAKWEPEDIAYEKEVAPMRLATYDSLYHAFSGDTTSREYLSILMWKAYYEILTHQHEEIKTRLPDSLINSSFTINGRNRQVQVLSRGPGHTACDLALYLPEDKILFSGDLIFNDCHPYLGHGNLDSLRQWLAHFETLEVQHLVPGHGEIGGKDEIAEMNNYITTLEQLVEKRIAEGASKEEILGSEIPEDLASWWFGRFFPSNLNFIYQQKVTSD